jgi:hypothetical protein
MPFVLFLNLPETDIVCDHCFTINLNKTIKLQSTYGIVFEAIHDELIQDIHDQNDVIAAPETVDTTIFPQRDTIQYNLDKIRQQESEHTRDRLCPNHFMDISNASVVFQSWIARDKPRQIIVMSPYDCESEMLQIKLEVMGKYIDYLIIGEPTTSNSNIPRELCYDKVRSEITTSRYASKIMYHIIEGKANNFQYWEQEVYVKNQLANPLIQNPLLFASIKEDAFLIMSDVDEIISQSHLYYLRYFDHPNSDVTNVFQISLRWSYYSFEWVNREPNTLNYIVTWHIFKDKCKLMPNYIRFNLCDMEAYSVLIPMAGWHCSWCFSNISHFIHKIERSSHSEYNQKKYKDIEFLQDQKNRGLWFVDANQMDVFASKECNYKQKYNCKLIQTYKENTCIIALK